MTKNQSGFTLVEVLIFTVLFSLIFITLTSLTAVSVRTSRLGAERIRATHYAEELREWLRGEREVDWNAFVQEREGTWCFNQEPVVAWGVTGNCNSYDIDGLYQREVSISANPAETQVTISIVVQWLNVEKLQTVRSDTLFSIWD